MVGPTPPSLPYQYPALLPWTCLVIPPRCTDTIRPFVSSGKFVLYALSDFATLSYFESALFSWDASSIHYSGPHAISNPKQISPPLIDLFLTRNRTSCTSLYYRAAPRLSAQPVFVHEFPLFVHRLGFSHQFRVQVQSLSAHHSTPMYTGDTHSAPDLDVLNGLRRNVWCNEPRHVVMGSYTCAQNTPSSYSFKLNEPRTRIRSRRRYSWQSHRCRRKYRSVRFYTSLIPASGTCSERGVSGRQCAG
jgi:hypothetical protein